MKVLLLDNYDSFTYNLYDYLLQAGVACTVVRNDALNEADFLWPNFDAIVLSPGPKRPENAGIMPKLIAHFHSRVPMLGICLGHQGIGEFFGARLVKAAEPVHGKTSIIRHNGHHPLFAGIPTAFSVMRYHSLLLEELEHTPLQALAHTDTGEVMALAHRTLPVFGVQFHPESILTDFGKELLRNWVDIAENAVIAQQILIDED